MKRVFRNNRLLAIAFITVFTVASAPAVMANGTKPVIPVELKLVGSIKNQPLFQLNFAGSPEDNEFTIIIRDEAGNSIYRENIKGEVFSKKFLINTEELGDTPIVFEIVSRKTNQHVTFQVNNNHRVVDEMVINEVK